MALPGHQDMNSTIDSSTLTFPVRDWNTAQPFVPVAEQDEGDTVRPTLSDLGGGFKTGSGGGQG